MFSRIGIVVALVMTIEVERSLANELPPVRLSLGPFSAGSERGTIPATDFHPSICNVSFHTEPWDWQILPDGFIYPTYLAAIQNRLDCAWNYDKHTDWVWDITLGGRAPLMRYGNRSPLYPEGWQLDMDGSVRLRLGLHAGMDMIANDFRFGFPVSYGTKVWQVRTGYYHVSTHVGDERVLRDVRQDAARPGGVNPNFDSDRDYRLNYYREAWLLSYAFRPTPNTRLYAEVDYAFMAGIGTEPWHFQFGAEYSPRYPAQGWRGTPFAAVNARLMQEYDYDATFTVQTGWQWRGLRNELFRVGVQYYTGASDQYSFILGRKEHKIGIGVWYDF